MANALVIYRDKVKTNSWVRWMVGRTMKQNKNNLISVVGKTGCQPKGSKVLMVDGEWKNIEDIKKGDLILSPQKDGSYEFGKVIKTFKWKSDENYDVYQLNKQKKKLYSCSSNHLIPVYHRFQKQKGKKWKHKNISAREMSQQSKSLRGHQDICFSCFPIPYFQGRKNCEIEPYTLGTFLGDGMFRDNFQIVKEKKRIRRAVNITTADFEIISEISKHYPIMSIFQQEKNKSKMFYFSLNSKLSNLLSRYKLNGKKSGNKFIPKEALLSDSEYRKKLLAGLIDTDGYYQKKRGGYQFTLKSKQLIEDIKDLVYSLGGRCGAIREVKKRIKKINFTGTYYSLCFYLGDLKLPLKLERKKRDVSTIYLEPNRIAINSIKNNKKEMVYGFELDSKSKWYVTDNWMVTHNSGKTWSALSICEIMSKGDGVNFNIEHVVFSLRELMDLINSDKLKRGSKIVFDEPQISISAREFQSQANKVFNYLITTFRHKNLTLFFCTPFETLLDKNTRRLFHARFETMSINKNKNTCRLKPRFIEYSDYKDKIYRKQLIVQFKDEHGNGKFRKLFHWDVPKPSKELIEQYEKKKLDFTTLLNRNISERLRKYDESGKSMTSEQTPKTGKPLTELQEKIWELIKKGITRPTEIGKLLGKSTSQISVNIKYIRNKGYNIDKYR